MVRIEQILTPEINQLLSEFSNLGGVLDFKIFKITGPYISIEAHVTTARHTLELLKQDNDKYFDDLSKSLGTDRDMYFKIDNKHVLADSGTLITPSQFFGHYHDIKSQGNLTNFINNNSDFTTQGYTYAFLNPPYSFGKTQMTDQEIERYFINFNQFMFNDISKLTIYSWLTDCSNYFEAGNEWWGSFFWTVYNPEKDWFIGIAASTTD